MLTKLTEEEKMVRIIMHGCNGHMGQVLTGIVKEDKDAEIVAGIDLVDNRDNGYPVFKSLKGGGCGHRFRFCQG